MIKKILLVLSLLALCSCSSNSNSLEADIKAKIQAVSSAKIGCIADNNKGLYSYYIEPSVGNIKSTKTSNVFTMSGYSIVMNLDIANIINEEYYKDQISRRKASGNEVIYLTGNYVDCNDKTKNYYLSVYSVEGGKYYMELNTAYVSFYTYADYVIIDDIVEQLFVIAKTVEIDQQEVIAYFSSKPSELHEREKQVIVDQIISEEGRLDELLNGGSGEFGDNYEGNTNQDDIDFDFTGESDDIPDNWGDDS